MCLVCDPARSNTHMTAVEKTVVRLTDVLVRPPAQKPFWSSLSN